MSETRVCWNCRAAVARNAEECPFCYAGLDPVARGLSPELAAKEEQGLIPVERSAAPPPSELGCLAMVGLILAGIVTAMFVAAILGFSAHHEPCTGSVSDCGEYGGITTGLSAFFVAVPICCSLYIWLADRSIKKTRERYDATVSDESKG